MAGLFDKQAEIYLDARPTYPKEWFSMLSALTSHHSLAWDVGTGNGQSAISIAEHYEKVIATDISLEQIKHAIPNPRVQYCRTSLAMSDDEIVSLVGEENSVDLITVSAAVHWFDLDRFYSQVQRLLRKPGGIIAVWTYNLPQVNLEFDPLMQKFYEKSLPFQNPKTRCAYEGYKELPFPFESVGIGCEGQPKVLEMSKEVSFEGMVRLLKSWSAVNTAKDHGVNLLCENVTKAFEKAWGGSDVVRTVIYKTYMIVGRVKQ